MAIDETSFAHVVDRLAIEAHKSREQPGPNNVSGMRSGTSLNTTLVTAIATSWAAFLTVVIMGVL